MKGFLASTINTHKRNCEGSQLADNLATAGKMIKIMYVALPLSVILLIYGAIRSFFNF